MAINSPKPQKNGEGFDYVGSSGPWVSKDKERFFEAFKFYLKVGYGRRRNPLFYPLRQVSRWRCKNDQFKFPVEKMIIEILRPKKQLS